MQRDVAHNSYVKHTCQPLAVQDRDKVEIYPDDWEGGFVSIRYGDAGFKKKKKKNMMMDDDAKS